MGGWSQITSHRCPCWIIQNPVLESQTHTRCSRDANRVLLEVALFGRTRVTGAPLNRHTAIMEKSKPKVASQQDAGANKLSMEALNKKFADAVFRVLQFDGHYNPHITASLSSALSGNIVTDGPCRLHVQIQIATDVCAKPSSKRAVLIRLYELLQKSENDSPFSPLGRCQDTCRVVLDSNRELVETLLAP